MLRSSIDDPLSRRRTCSRADSRADYRANSFTIAIRADRNQLAAASFPTDTAVESGKKLRSLNQGLTALDRIWDGAPENDLQAARPLEGFGAADKRRSRRCSNESSS